MKKWLSWGQTEHERVTALLSAYMDGQVKAREWEQVEKHLQTCAACRENLTTLRATVQAVRALPTVHLPRSFVLPRALGRQPRPAWTFPIFRAATAVAAALLLVVMAGDLSGLGAQMLPAHQTEIKWIAAAPTHESPPPTPALLVKGLEAAPTSPEPMQVAATAPPSILPDEARLGAAAAEAGATPPLWIDTPAASADNEGSSGIVTPPPSGVPAPQAPTDEPPAVYNVEPGLSQVTPPTPSPLWLRAIEIGLAGLTLLLGALTLVTSGRIRR